MNFPKKSRVGEYACYLLLFAVLCLEPRYSAPFAAGLFSALAANGRKPILLAPLYLLSSFAGGLSAAAFFPALFCVAAVIIVRFLCFAIKKPFLVLAAALSAALSQIPTLLFSPVTQDALAYTAVALSLSAFSAYAFSLILRTSFFQNPLTLDGLGADEKISAAILFSALSLGLYGAPLQSHELYLLVSVFFILVFIRRSRYGAGFCLSICAGFAAYLTDGSTMYLVLLCGIAAVSATLRTLSVYLGAVGALGYYVLLSFFSESLAFYPFAAAAIAAGALIAVLIPLKNALDGNVPTAERSIVRNSRLILKRKLTGLESAFSEISVLLRRVSGVTEGNAEQFEGVAGIFKRLEKDFDAGTTFDPVLEQRLIEALSRETVPTQEIAVCGAGNSLRVLIVIDARTARDMFADTAR
ncbi:MAG: hypothetical protein LBT20_00675, partial [Clostridiales bacterium]|nr:hypothetical protein [Clostridiales bacterium]